MTKARSVELAVLALLLAAQAYLFTRPLHSAANYDESVYLAALDALRHGQALGSDVFAAQFPGFYDLLRGLSFITGVGVVAIRAGLIAVTMLGTIGGYLVGRRFGGAVGGLLVASLLAIAPPLDLFGFQVIADTPALALTVLSLGIATLAGLPAAIFAGAVFAAAVSVKLTAITAIPPLLWLLGRRRVLPAVVGAAVIGAAILLAHVRALGDLWTSGVTYHTDARSTPAVIPHPHHQILDQIPHGTPFFLLAVVAIVAGAAMFALRRPLGVWPLWSWVALSVVFLLTHAPLHYNHLIIFPFTLAVAAGSTIGAAVHRLPVTAARAALAVLAVAVAGGFVQQLHRVRLAETPQAANERAAARALARLTAPGALTADDRPIISFLAHRRVVGSLVDTAYLRFATGSLTNAKVITDLRPADAVVISRSLGTRPPVVAFVRAHYHLRYDQAGITIYTR